MITNNYRNFCATMLQSLGNNCYGMFPVTTVGGTVRYCSCYYGRYPCTVTTDVVKGNGYAGIHFGSGTTAPARTDYTLEKPITSGFSASVTYKRGLDSGDPYVEFTIVVTNTGDSPITITEIGYYQTINTVAGVGVVASDTNEVVCLDRSLLDSPLTVSPGAPKAIIYTLKTTGI